MRLSSSPSLIPNTMIPCRGSPAWNLRRSGISSRQGSHHVAHKTSKVPRRCCWKRWTLPPVTSGSSDVFRRSPLLTWCMTVSACTACRDEQPVSSPVSRHNRRARDIGFYPQAASVFALPPRNYSNGYFAQRWATPRVSQRLKCEETANAIYDPL